MILKNKLLEKILIYYNEMKGFSPPIKPPNAI